MKYTLNAPCTTVMHGLSAAGAKAGVKKYTSDHPPLLCDLIFSNLSYVSNLSTRSNLTSVLRCYTYILDVLVISHFFVGVFQKWSKLT